MPDPYIPPQPQLQSDLSELTAPTGTALFEQLKMNGTHPFTMSVTALFKLATDCAIVGNLGARNHILSIWIAAHPQATTEELQRVAINDADCMRRDGKPFDAAQILESMTHCDVLINKIERLQALNQCLLQMAKLTTDGHEEELRLLKRAVDNQDHLAAIACAPDSGIPAHTQSFYLVGVAQLRGSLIRATGLEQDLKIEHALHYALGLLEKGGVEARFANRMAWELPYAKGLYHLDCKKFDLATKWLLQSWEAAHTVASKRDTACVALAYMESSIRNSGPSRDTEPFKTICGYVSGNSLNVLLKGDLPILAERISFVESYLGKGYFNVQALH